MMFSTEINNNNTVIFTIYHRHLVWRPIIQNNKFTNIQAKEFRVSLIEQLSNGARNGFVQYDDNRSYK